MLSLHPPSFSRACDVCCDQAERGNFSTSEISIGGAADGPLCGLAPALQDPFALQVLELARLLVPVRT